MKYLLFALLLMVSCSEERVAKTYESLEGNWKFNSKEVSGEFTIEDVNGDLVVDRGWYEFNGNHYEATIKKAVEDNQNYQITLFLSVDKYIGIAFRFCDYTLDYTKITPSEINVYDSGPITTYTGIVITR